MTTLFCPNMQYTLQPSHTPAGCETLQRPAPSQGFREGPTGSPDLLPKKGMHQPTSPSQHQRSLWALGPLPRMAVFRQALL